METSRTVILPAKVSVLCVRTLTIPVLRQDLPTISLSLSLSLSLVCVCFCLTNLCAGDDLSIHWHQFQFQANPQLFRQKIIQYIQYHQKKEASEEAKN